MGDTAVPRRRPDAGYTGLKVDIARLEGKVDTVVEAIKGQHAETMAAITFGDRENAQSIQFLKDRVEKAEKANEQLEAKLAIELAMRDKRVSENRRLAWSTLAAPFLLIILGAIFYAAVGLH